MQIPELIQSTQSHTTSLSVIYVNLKLYRYICLLMRIILDNAENARVYTAFAYMSVSNFLHVNFAETMILVVPVIHVLIPYM